MEWYLTDWDIQLKRILPSSDHFDFDNYDFYDPFSGSFEIGSCRSYTIGELSKFTNSW